VHEKRFFSPPFLGAQRRETLRKFSNALLFMSNVGIQGDGQRPHYVLIDPLRNSLR